MSLIPRKHCPKCGARFEGEGVRDLHSCDVCGNGYLSVDPDLDTDKPDETPLPRAGGVGNMVHTRDGF